LLLRAYGGAGVDPLALLGHVNDRDGSILDEWRPGDLLIAALRACGC
jgi:hypothetical protein